jgi:hypothetical protein
MVSTRTFLFETKASNEKLLKELLSRRLDGDDRPLIFTNLLFIAVRQRVKYLEFCNLDDVIRLKHCGCVLHQKSSHGYIETC